MAPPDDVRIRHLVEVAEKAVAYAGRSREDLEADELLRLALTKLVEIVGEAAKQISDATRAQYWSRYRDSTSRRTTAAVTTGHG